MYRRCTLWQMGLDRHDPTDAKAWFNLGIGGGGTVGGVPYGKKACYEQALQHDPGLGPSRRSAPSMFPDPPGPPLLDPPRPS